MKVSVERILSAISVSVPTWYGLWTAPPLGAQTVSRRPARFVAPRSSSSRESSGFGSTTTTPNPRRIAANAISAIVTVLPDPVAPATRVMAARDPQTGIRTAAPVRSWPTATPSSVTHRRSLIRRWTARARVASVMPRHCLARVARSPPASSSRPYRCTPVATATIAAALEPMAACKPIRTATGTASSVGSAQDHAKPRQRNTTASTAPTATPASANSPAVRTTSAKCTIGTTGTPAVADRTPLPDEPLAATRSHLDPVAPDSLDRTEASPHIRY